MIIGNNVILREKSLADAKEDYAWEKDPELAHLDAAPVVSIPFSQYLSEYEEELNYYFKSSRRLAVDTLDGKHIGNCSYYNISESKGEAELGIMIGDRDYWDKGYGTDVITTLVNHIFKQPNFTRIYLKTLHDNVRAQKCFQKCGFSLFKYSSGGSYRFALMEIQREQWLKQQGNIS